jgi:hypothetical protein
MKTFLGAHKETIKLPSPAVLLGIGDAFDSSFEDGCGADLKKVKIFEKFFLSLVFFACF